MRFSWRRRLPYMMHIFIEVKVQIFSLFYKIEIACLIEDCQIFLHILIDLFELLCILQLN